MYTTLNDIKNKVKKKTFILLKMRCIVDVNESVVHNIYMLKSWRKKHYTLSCQWDIIRICLDII